MVEPNRKRAIVLLVYLALALTTLAVYWPATSHEFVVWDDNGFVYENSMVRTGLTWDNFVWSWGIHGPGQWHPLAWWSHQLDSELFGAELDGPAAGRHHLVNLMLHVAASLALLTAFWRLTSSFWPSALVAALFALHPLSVESVAWVSERRDTLSTLFWALVMWSYAGYARRGGIPRYLLVLLLFALGLMAKPMLVTLPFVLLLLDYWPLNRLKLGVRDSNLGAKEPQVNTRKKNKRVPNSAPPAPSNDTLPIAGLLLEKMPLFVLSGVSIWLTYLCQKDTGAVVSLDSHSLGARFANATQSYVLYLGNMFSPTKLSPIYPFPFSFEAWQVACAAVLLVTITGAAIYFGRERRYLLVGWLWYLGTLLPVIGLLKMGVHVAMADRWVYVPIVGIYVVISWTLAEWVRRWPVVRPVVIVTVAAVFLALLPLSRQQVGVWRDSVTLFERALDVTESNPVAHYSMGVALETLDRREDAIIHYQAAVNLNPIYAIAHNNLGAALQSVGRTDEAIRHHESALQVNPEDGKAHYNLGIAKQAQGRSREAIDHYEIALEIDPDHAKAHNNLGVVLHAVGRSKEAINHYRTAIQLKQDYAKAHNNLGNALQSVGRHEEAIDHYQIALQINPDYAEAHNNWALSLQTLNRPQEAIVQFQTALKIKPDYAEARSNLGNLFQRLDRLDEAIEQYERSLQIDPNSMRVHANYAEALLRVGRNGDALRHFREAIRIKPDVVAIQTRLAQVLMQSGEYRDAIPLFEQMLQKNPSQAGIHDNLGFCLLRLGQLDEAVEHFQEELRLDPDSLNAHSNLGRTHLRQEKYDQAVAHYGEALRISPDHLVTLNDLAWLLATCAEAKVRDGARAVELAERAAQITGHKNFAFLDTLSTAHAEAGNFAEAIRWQTKALELAPEAKQERLRIRLEMYNAGKPFRDVPETPVGGK